MVKKSIRITVAGDNTLGDANSLKFGTPTWANTLQRRKIAVIAKLRALA